MTRRHPDTATLVCGLGDAVLVGVAEAALHELAARRELVECEDCAIQLANGIRDLELCGPVLSNEARVRLADMQLELCMRMLSGFDRTRTMPESRPE